MRYIYRAKRGPEEVVEGTVDAANQDAVVAKIIEQGLVPVLVEEEAKYLARKSSSRPVRSGYVSILGGRIRKAHIYDFTKKLKTLLKSQVPILDSLFILYDQTAHKGFKDVIGALINLVKEGANFSESLERFPQHFSPLYISIIKAGEASGSLDSSLEQISKYLDNERQMSMKVKSSLAYPAVMIFVGFATLIFLMTFVIPKLSVLFEDFADKLPIITKGLLGASAFFSRYWILLGVLFVAFVIFLYYTRGATWQKRIVSTAKRRTPVVSSIIYNQSLSRLARALSILLSSGVSLLESVKMVTPLIDDPAAQSQLNNAHKQIVSGTGLEESLRNNCAFLPDLFIKMVAVGEASGRLDEILMELAENYAEEVDSKTKIMTSLIEPMAILVVGSILSLIVIAVLLPIFEISFFIQ